MRESDQELLLIVVVLCVIVLLCFLFLFRYVWCIFPLCVFCSFISFVLFKEEEGIRVFCLSSGIGECV